MRHLERIVSGIEWLHAGVQGNEKPWCFVVLDTLHLTHCVRPGVVRWFEVESFDRRLAAVGCKLLFLRASTCAIEERGIAPRRNEQFLLQYAGKFGQSEEEIHAYFVREQETLSELFSRSAMRKVIVEDEGALQPQVDKIYEFWMES